jgi:uncharacterized protein YegL
MRRSPHRRRACCCAAILALLFILPLEFAASGRVTPLAVAQRGEESPCVPAESAGASPSTLLLGETAGVTINVKSLCAGETYPLAISLVLDASGAMAGSPQSEQRDAAAELVRALNLRDNPCTVMGLVEFAATARVAVPLTNNEGTLLSGINRIGATGPQSVASGIDVGARMLNRYGEPLGSPEGDGVHRVLILMSVGPEDSCADAKRAAGKAKNRGILVAAVCVGPSCNSGCMREIASSSRVYATARSMKSILGYILELRDTLRNIVMKEMSIEFALAEGMRFVPGSASPEPMAVDLSQGTIRWRTLDNVHRSDFTVTLEVLPLVAGQVPVARSIVGQGRDNELRTMRVWIKSPEVLVLRSDYLPTANAARERPTAEPSSTKHSVPRPTQVPSPTPTATLPRPPSDTPEPAPAYPGPGRRDSFATLFLPLAVVGR